MQTQNDYLLNFLADHQDCIIVGSLGTISYDLEKIPHPNKIVVKGAMGHAIAVGLGYALHTEKDVHVFIGDGAALMKLGSLSDVRAYNKGNLSVTIMNNGVHESTGGQETNFETVREDVENFCDVITIHN